MKSSCHLLKINKPFLEVNQKIDTLYTREVAAEDSISAAHCFKTLVSGFWLPPKAFSVGETSR
jgi:hypothetical protein